MYSLTPGRGCELIVTNEMAYYTVFAVTIQSSINCLYMSDCACSRSDFCRFIKLPLPSAQLNILLN
jgi:hypothetical protein